MISPSSIVSAGKDQISADLAGEAVILHLETGAYYGLARVGARIWELLRQPIRVAAIQEIICREYEVDPQRCARDLAILLEELANAGLIEISDESDQAVP